MRKKLVTLFSLLIILVLSVSPNVYAYDIDFKSFAFDEYLNNNDDTEASDKDWAKALKEQIKIPAMSTYSMTLLTSLTPHRKRNWFRSLKTLQIIVMLLLSQQHIIHMEVPKLSL